MVPGKPYIHVRRLEFLLSTVLPSSLSFTHLVHSLLSTVAGTEDMKINKTLSLAIVSL